MAMLHPAGRLTVRRPSSGRRPLHPAFGLVIGFGAITLAAAAVHVIFRLI